MHTINCQVCGSQRKTNRSNTKYCAFHSFLRDVTYMRQNLKKAHRKCLLCSTDFLALRSTDSTCADCAMFGLAPDIECVRCHETRPAACEGLRLCLKCAQDPQNNEYLLHQLALKHRTLMDDVVAVESL